MAGEPAEAISRRQRFLSDKDQVKEIMAHLTLLAERGQFETITWGELKSKLALIAVHI